jgi:hypothetical protein
MSSNSAVRVVPVRVGAAEHVSVAEVLGSKGPALLEAVLGRLPELREGFSSELLAEFDWHASAKRGVWHTRIGRDTVELDLSAGSVARLRIAGTRYVEEGQSAEMEPAVRAQARRRVNGLLGLALAERVAQRLEVYVQQRARTKGVQRIQLKAVAAGSRTALRASTRIKFA